MTEYFSKAPVRIPVKLVDGEWEFFYGGGLPIKEGTIGDLTVEKAQITDKKFLALLSKRAEYKLLEEGAELLIALTVRATSELSAELRKHLIAPSTIRLGPDYYCSPRPSETLFVQVNIGPPTSGQVKHRGWTEGGVWLQAEGGQTKGVLASSVFVPDEISKQPLDSLNHAFTRLSESYEPWRQSHTGSIYTRVVYQEKNEKWYPLEVLRSAATAKDEHALIKEHWSRIEAQLMLTLPTSSN